MSSCCASLTPRRFTAIEPFTRVGNQHVLPAEAAPPSVYALLMLAYMPLFRNEHHDAVALIYHHVSQPLPRQEPMQLCGKTVVEQPHLVIGDMLPNRNAADTDVVLSVTWLELMARLGFLRKNDNWCKLYDRFRRGPRCAGRVAPAQGSRRTAQPEPISLAHVSDRESNGRRRTLDGRDVPTRVDRAVDGTSDRVGVRR
jgi:hypothetical protein